MLVLSRKVGERITIGDDVQITITRVAGGRVTIGIDAPKDVMVRRNELVLRQLEKQRRFDASCGPDGPVGSALTAPPESALMSAT